ncbi:MAG: hypothetical protein FWC23_08670 [Chitinispirillia bacterium]|nr:hypothetical protein [Chitinispirillia bacterium]MCL2269241.1 hypothetical protein [Chitinispirillia bacterium]
MTDQSKIKDALDEYEDIISKTEKSIFNEGPFSAKKVQEQLGLITSLIRLGDNSISLVGKQNYYNDTYNEIISKNITPIKLILMELRKKSSLDTISSLLERCEECEAEIQRIRDIIQDY